MVCMFIKVLWPNYVKGCGGGGGGGGGLQAPVSPKYQPTVGEEVECTLSFVMAILFKDGDCVKGASFAK